MTHSSSGRPSASVMILPSPEPSKPAGGFDDGVTGSHFSRGCGRAVEPVIRICSFESLGGSRARGLTLKAEARKSFMPPGTTSSDVCGLKTEMPWADSVSRLFCSGLASVRDLWEPEGRRVSGRPLSDSTRRRARKDGLEAGEDWGVVGDHGAELRGGESLLDDGGRQVDREQDLARALLGDGRLCGEDGTRSA